MAAESLSREQIRDIDRRAIEEVGIPGVVLMENAGRNAAMVIAEFLGSARLKKVAIVAGSGNNGGDGFVVARHLQRMGASVTTFLLTPPEKITGDAKINLDIIRRLDHDIRPLPRAQFKQLAEQLSGFDLIVDAIGGTGISPPLREDLAEAVEQLNAAGRPVVAVDIPTGLDCDSGPTGGPAVRAALTVTMVARKKGFDAPGAEQFIGQVRVVDIGISADQLPAAAVRKA